MIVSLTAMAVLILWVTAACCYLLKTPEQPQTRIAQPARNPLPRWEQPELIATPAPQSVLRYRETDAKLLEEAVLQYTGLAGLGETFVQCGRDSNVDPVLLAAICALESGWGGSLIAKEKNNLAGLQTDEGSTYRIFGSRTYCVQYLAMLLDSDYRAGGTYYGGGESVEDIAEHYNPARTEKWAEQVKNIMAMMEEKMRES